MATQKSYNVITNQIVELLEAGTIPWHKPWQNGPATRSYSGREYRGINVFVLSAIASLRGLRGCWMTFNQVKKLGGSVKKGAKGVQVVYWQWIKEKDDDDEETGRTFPICRFYTVFSLCQTEGIKEPAWVKNLERDGASKNPIEAAEQIWEGYRNRPALTFGGDEAAYYPRFDKITMPQRDQFDSPEDFYGTLFHESIHSTGSKKRLDRSRRQHQSRSVWI